MKTSARHGQVTTEKLAELYQRVDAIAEELFDRDEDGDLPVEIQLVDRTRHESIAGLIPVPYLVHAETAADFDEIMRALLHNLGRCTRDIEKLLQVRKSADLRPERPQSVPAPPVVVEKKSEPTIHSVQDLVVGDLVLVLPTANRPARQGKVIDLVASGDPLTDDEIAKWLHPDPKTTEKQLIRMRKAVAYDRFVIELSDKSYLIVPRLPEQLKQMLVVLR